MDYGFNIKTTSDDAAILAFKDKVENTKMTVKDLSAATRELRNNMIAGSQAQKDAADVLYQVSQQTKSAAQQQNSLIGIMKQDRQERRLGMFAVMESMHALEGITGKQNDFSKAITNGAQTVFGMKFALEAMGVAAKAAWPVAIIVAAWSVISGILDSEKEKNKEIADELQKQYDLKVKLGLISPTQQLSNIGGSINQTQAEISALENQRAKEQAIYDLRIKSTATMDEARDAMWAIQDIDKQLLPLRTQLLQQEVEYKAIFDAQQKNKQKNVDSTKQDIKDQTSAMWQLGKLDDASYLAILKKREQEAILLKQYDTELTLRTMIAEVEGKIASNKLPTGTLGGALAGGKFNLIGTGIENLGKVTDRSAGKGKTTEQLNAESDQREAEQKEKLTQEYLIDPLKSGFQSVAYSALTGFNQMWEQSSGFARTVIGQALGSIADKLISNVEDELIGKSANFLLALIGLAGGGDVSYGGGLKFAASGINLPYGNGIQNVVVGENGRELMQVGRNGVRVISNNNLRQISQSSKGNGNVDMARAIQSLADKIIPASMNEVNTLIIKQNNLRGKRIMSPTQ